MQQVVFNSVGFQKFVRRSKKCDALLQVFVIHLYDKKLLCISKLSSKWWKLWSILFHYRGLAWIYWLPPDKSVWTSVSTVTMTCCSPFSKCCYQPIVITMISLWVRRTVVLGLWSYFFECFEWYLRYRTSYARPLYQLCPNLVCNLAFPVERVI